VADNTPKPPTVSSDAVWDRPTRLGYAEGLRGLGGVVAPVLAGFSLAAIAQILTASTPPHLGSWALVAFASAVAFLLHCMQVAYFALARDPQPATHLSWYPEALVDEEKAREVRRLQAKTFEEVVRYWLRANVTYDLGLTSFLAGVVLLLIPGAHHWSGVRIVALVVASGALLLEVWWALANRVTSLPHPVVPRVKPEPIVEELDPKLLWAILDPARVEASAAQPDEARSMGGRAVRAEAHRVVPPA
jgi:hypothetical protein